MTVTENILLGAEITTDTLRFWIWMLDVSASSSCPSSMVGRRPRCGYRAASVGVQQRRDFKALYRNARILILDEPTAVLTSGDRDLFG